MKKSNYIFRAQWNCGTLPQRMLWRPNDQWNKKGMRQIHERISIRGIIITCHSAWIDKVYGLFLTRMHSHLPASPSLAFPCAHPQLQPCNTSLLSAFGAAHPTEHQNCSVENKRREDKNLKRSGFFLAKLVFSPLRGFIWNCHAMRCIQSLAQGEWWDKTAPNPFGCRKQLIQLKLPVNWSLKLFLKNCIIM